MANRGEEVTPDGQQIAYLVGQYGSIRQFLGKKQIAKGIINYLEKWRELL